MAEPVVIFEILSDSTSRTDTTVKLAEYTSMASVQRYIMLDQLQVSATVIARTGHGWSIARLHSSEVLDMPEIGIEVPLSELYDEVEFPPLPE